MDGWFALALIIPFGALLLAGCLKLNQSISNLENQQKLCVMLPILLGLISPPLIKFLVQYIVGKLSVARAIKQTEILSWLVFSPVTLLPFAVLTITLILSTKVYSLRATYVLCFGGLTGIFWGMVPQHVKIWSLFYKPHVHVSSTTAIAFLFIPFYCFVPLGIGLAISWIITRLPFFRDKNEKVI